MNTPSERDVIAAITQAAIMPVLRSPSLQDCIETARALVRGGIEVVEITFSTPGAIDAIADLASSSDCVVGAGTVLTPEQAEAAVAAGAAFLVSPVNPPWLLDVAQSLGVVAVPGCATPNEIWSATSRGAKLVKVFPIARLGGAPYIRDLFAPMPDLRLIATGGIKAVEAPILLAAGCIAVGLGSIHTDDSLGTSVEERGRTALSIARGGGSNCE